MSFEQLVDAVRVADGDDPELATATQLRLRRSLEVRARGRHQLAGIATAIAILSGGTVSWALATGRATALWAPAPLPTRDVAPPPAPPPAPGPHRHAHAGAHRVVPAPASETAPVPEHRSEAALVPEATSAPVLAPVPAPDLALATVPRSTPLPETAVPVPAPPVRAPVTTPRIARPPAPVEALYRKAHELHFHGGDPVTTLAAWDAYLAAEPDGRFSVDARYNRAIILARLGRYAEARAALEPFARGTVEPPGYRQREAEQLVERLARYE